ncbi:recombinase family protein [Actinomycetospora endophytica]|uniref:Recombinase family protein n=1 Tax=Actinomycetospora endophytica TaxID=2291215 RepID=A0ABS8PFB7_9PSEU|nr:recombinase family protein [Actinomycetospora endophytica]MCD2195699.1 recombinase family protein [Actinomycetospora endophytica]
MTITREATTHPTTALSTAVPAPRGRGSATPPRHPVVIYGRVSSERSGEQSKSVDDQLRDLRAWADREGWPVVAECRDDGISASKYAKGKERPGWKEATAHIERGGVRALLVWDYSRAGRDDKVTAALKAACTAQGVKIGYGGQLRDPATADGSFYIGLDGLLAAKLSADISEKVQRSVSSRANQGAPHGAVPYGYRIVRDDRGRTVDRVEDPETAPIVREIVARLLAGDAAKAIADDLNRRGVPTAKGAQWNGVGVSRAARNPAIAGLRLFRGEATDVRATWDPIISAEDHDRIVALYGDPERDKHRNGTRTAHLGSGIYRCGRDGCDGRMKSTPRPDRSPRYSCRACHKASIGQEQADTIVESLLIARLSSPDAVIRLSRNDRTDAQTDAAAKVADLDAELAQWRAGASAGAVTFADFAAFREGWEKRMADAQAAARPRHLPTLLTENAGPGFEVWWAGADTTERRTVLDAAARVTILPVGPGQGRPGGADPADRVRVEWRTAED